MSRSPMSSFVLAYASQRLSRSRRSGPLPPTPSPQDPWRLSLTVAKLTLIAWSAARLLVSVRERGAPDGDGMLAALVLIALTASFAWTDPQ